MQVRIGLILLVLSYTNQLEMGINDSKLTHILTPHASVNLYKSAYYLVYEFNVHSIQYILGWYADLDNVCQEQGDILKPLREEIRTNMFWNFYKPFSFKFNNIHRVEFNLEADILLERDLEWFTTGTGVYACTALKKLSETFVSLNKNLNKLYRLNATTILELMSLDSLAIDVITLLKKSEKENDTKVYPFDFFRGFKNKFFEHTRLSFFQDNYTISLLFEIPDMNQLIYIRMTFCQWSLTRDHTFWILNKNS